MMPFATETWLQLIAVGGESASVLFLMYGAWLVLLYYSKASTNALRHLGLGKPA